MKDEEWRDDKSNGEKLQGTNQNTRRGTEDSLLSTGKRGILTWNS